MLPINEPSAIWVADAHGLAAEDLDAVIDGLIAEFARELQDAVVIEHVVLACQQLSAGGVPAGLVPATESMARARLRAVAGRGGAERATVRQLVRRTRCLAPRRDSEMRAPAPSAGDRPTETISLTCGHQLKDCIVNHPMVLPGSSIRCPACTVPRTILRVENSPAASGRSSWAHDTTASRHKILVIDDTDGF